MFAQQIAHKAPNLRIGLQWIAVGALLSVCLWHAIAVQKGVPAPPDVDSWRDLGLIQALLDGNFWGDPSYSGEWRYYPPLIHIVVAAAAYVLNPNDLLLFWTRAGIWLNLLTPVTFFLMCRGLFSGSAAAVAATCFYVLWSGSIAWPWLMGGYSPWPLTPVIAQSTFFVGVLAIVTTRSPSLGTASLVRAALIGLLIGLSTLAHLVPGIILTAIVVGVAMVQVGAHVRAHVRIIVWLGVVGLTALATAAPYLAVSLHYPAGVVNGVYTAYAIQLMQPDNLGLIVLLNACGAIASIATLAIARRRRDIPLRSAAALLTWIGVCLLFLARHYVCALTAFGQVRACHSFAPTIHHFHLYLQDAWACLMGYVAYAVFQIAAKPSRPRWLQAAVSGVLLALLLIGWRSYLNNFYDKMARLDAIADGRKFDVQAYRWILAGTSPQDIFVTELYTGWTAPAAFTVLAAGRQVVAAPVLFSNPFVDWDARDARRKSYLDAAMSDADGDGRFCDFRGQTAYLLVPRNTQVRSPRLHPVFASEFLAAYRISTDGC